MPTAIPAPPDDLYHYTSSSSLLAILDTRSMWATDIRYLNDSTELEFATSELQAHVRTLRPSEPQPRQLVLDEFLPWATGQLMSGPPVFVVSLTENGNLLSQWRGYAAGPSGISIGFSSRELSEVAKAQGFSLRKCIYTAEERREAIRSLVTEVVDRALAQGAQRGRLGLFTYIPVFESLAEELFLTCAVIKNQSFREESEWRLISPGRLPRNDYSNLFFRSGTTSIVPYTKITFPGDQPLTLINHIIIGPTPHHRLAMDAVVKLMGKYCETLCVSQSMLPLRPI